MTPTRIQASIPCVLCGENAVTVVSTRSRSGKPLRTVACTGCGLVWSDPRPHDARQFYAEDYRLSYKNTFTPRPKHVLRAGRVALDRLQRIRPVLHDGMAMLDVGSGGGEFAYLMKRLGMQVLGVEPNRGYAQYSEEQYGLEVVRGFIDQVELPTDRFDVITIWHVLEHTEDPVTVLRRLRRALRVGGHLVVEVPNVEATCQSPRSSFHEAHLYTFSRLTLAHLAAKCGLGAVSMQLSPDGGNITAVFVREPEAARSRPGSLRLPGHHAQVTQGIAGHTALSHALSLHPWRRAAGRLRRMVSEGWALRGGQTGKALLDALYATELRGGAARRPASRWGWIALAYALAVGAETLLLERLLASGDLGRSDAVVLYLAMQCIVVGALVWMLKEQPRTWRGLLRVGAWAAPLFAIPALL